MTTTWIDAGWTTVPNAALRDPALSIKAKGLYALMCSLDDSLDVGIQRLAALSADGESRTKAAVRELEDRGYLTRQVQRGSGGRITGMQYQLTHPD